MEDEDKVSLGEVISGLPVQGTSHLEFSNEEEGAEAGKEAGTEKGSAEQEEVLDLEEFSKRNSQINVKVLIAGEERLLSPDEAVRYHQKHAGLEKTTERKMQEASRLLKEVQDTATRIQTEIAGRKEAPAEDSDDPKVFVKNIANAEIDAAVNPKLQKLEGMISDLTSLLEPELAEASKKKAKSILKANKIDADFDKYDEAIMGLFESKAGRELTEAEIAKIPASTWVQGYLLASHGQAPEAKPLSHDKTKEKVKVVVGPGGGGGNSGASNEPMSQLMKQARETDDWSKVLLSRGVKPATAGG